MEKILIEFDGKVDTGVVKIFNFDVQEQSFFATDKDYVKLEYVNEYAKLHTFLDE